MHILLTGPSGQIGWELARALPATGRVTAVDRRRLDLARPGDIRAVVDALRPDLVVNAAGYTAVDRAEAEPDRAWAVNARAPGVLAREAARIGAALVHYSTDYVFDGRTDRPYTPTDPPAPLNAYGRSKLAGERAVLDAGGSALVLRTSWVYSDRRSNFALSVLRQAAAGKPLRVVDDQVGCPTPARLIAALTARIVETALRHREGRWTFGAGAGLRHLACTGPTSWYGFAQALLERACPAGAAAVEPIGSAEHAAPALRPAWSVLDVRELEAAFGVALPHWRTALEDVHDDLLAALAAERHDAAVVAHREDPR